MHSSHYTTVCNSAAAVLLLLLLLAPLASTQCPSSNGDWLLYKDSCYKYYNSSEFWYTAEMTCEESSGHLVSIDSDQENRLVGKLSLCRSVWIGQYASDLSKLTDPSGYAWTDESKGSGYGRHNFSDTPSIHQPLVRAQGLSWYNSLYHEQHPFVCEVHTTGEHKSECPSTMKFYQGNCYLLSGFDANFIEANFFCQNRSTQLASVLSESELRFLNTLDLGADECKLQSIWLGLIKLNPCYPDRGGREMCYQWTDFSGKHLGFPGWAEGQPAAAGEGNSENCAALSGDALVGTSCSDERRFVCKVPASSLTGDAWKALDEPPKPIGDETTGAGVQSNITDSESTELPVPAPSPASTPAEVLTEVPTIKPAEKTEVPTIEPAEKTEVPTIEPAEKTEVPTIEPAEKTEVPTIVPAETTEVPTIEPAETTVSDQVEPLPSPAENTDDRTAEDRFPWGLDRLAKRISAQGRGSPGASENFDGFGAGDK